jgi:hypothetical protein
MSYSLDGRKCVFVVNITRFIIDGNTKIRWGANHDQSAIETTFRNLNFDIINVGDQSSGEVRPNDITAAFQSFLNSNLDDIKLLSFVFMSHGSEGDKIQFTDGQMEKMLKILEPILIKKKLKAIPKLVITQFCRGSDMAATDMAATDQADYALSNLVNPQTDMVICYATAPGNLAIRNPNTGSYFIREICHQLNIRQRRSIHQEFCFKEYLIIFKRLNK